MTFRYKVNGKVVELDVDADHVAVRFKAPAKHSMRASVAEKCKLGGFQERCEVPEEKFTILPVGQAAKPRDERLKSAMGALTRNKEVARTAQVFKIGTARILATDRIMVGFQPGAKKTGELIKKLKGEIIEKLGDEVLIQLDETADPLKIANQLEKKKEVVYAEPDFVCMNSHVEKKSQPQPMGDDPQSHKQYPINLTKAADAWKIQVGDPNVVIAILDEGVDSDHEDLGGAIVGAYDGIDDDNFQEPNPWDGHGTACAGLAAAMPENNLGVRGIGGGCSIQAIRIAYSPSKGANWFTTNSWIKRAIDWAWQNGASVLSNSWGGGAPSSAIINAFERARTQGRNGKGCVIVAAAGNASGSVDFPGNLANVLTVSASNEYDEFKTKTSSDGEYWWGSNFGPEVDVAAPGVHNWTTDIMGSDGYTSGHYTSFNGTSSATPLVAGAAGLVLSLNPDLDEAQVRENIKKSADKVGSYAYPGGRNDQFGNGRLNVLGAVELSKPQQKSYVTVHKIMQDAPIKDMSASNVSVAVGDSKMLQNIKVHVDIEHTYIGDLRVKLHPPANSNESPILLHDRDGKGKDNLRKSYDTNSTPALKKLIGKNLQGYWMLEVDDHAGQDEGKIKSMSLELTY